MWELRGGRAGYHVVHDGRPKLFQVALCVDMWDAAQIEAKEDKELSLSSMDRRQTLLSLGFLVISLLLCQSRTLAVCSNIRMASSVAPPRLLCQISTKATELNRFLQSSIERRGITEPSEARGKAC